MNTPEKRQHLLSKISSFLSKITKSKSVSSDRSSSKSGSSDRSLLPSGGSDRPLSPNGSSDRSLLPNGGSDRSLLPSGGSDRPLSPNGSSDRSLLPNGDTCKSLKFHKHSLRENSKKEKLFFEENEKNRDLEIIKEELFNDQQRRAAIQTELMKDKVNQYLIQKLEKLIFVKTNQSSLLELVEFIEKEEEKELKIDYINAFGDVFGKVKIFEGSKEFAARSSMLEKFSLCTKKENYVNFQVQNEFSNFQNQGNLNVGNLRDKLNTVIQTSKNKKNESNMK